MTFHMKFWKLLSASCFVSQLSSTIIDAILKLLLSFLLVDFCLFLITVFHLQLIQLWQLHRCPILPRPSPNLRWTYTRDVLNQNNHWSGISSFHHYRLQQRLHSSLKAAVGERTRKYEGHCIWPVTEPEWLVNLKTTEDYWHKALASQHLQISIEFMRSIACKSVRFSGTLFNDNWHQVLIQSAVISYSLKMNAFSIRNVHLNVTQ